MKYNEISVSWHPKHKLKLESTKYPFKCDGCREVGIGSHYKCTTCDYDLHTHCALPSPTISHLFYPNCSFHFLTRPPGDVPRYCNACDKDVSGFLYHCKACGFDLHPCCAKLPMSISDGKLKLILSIKVNASCHRCGRKGKSWSYRSECKKYNLHVACVREMLVESWHEIYGGGGSSHDKKKNNLGTNNKIPTLKATLESYDHHHHQKISSKGKVQKCYEMAGLAVQFVVSALLGDPTALIAGLVGSLISK